MNSCKMLISMEAGVCVSILEFSAENSGCILQYLFNTYISLFVLLGQSQPLILRVASWNA